MAGKVNLQAHFARFDDYWNPKIVASVNDYDVKLVKVQGGFVWHQHDETDEVLVVRAQARGVGHPDRRRLSPDDPLGNNDGDAPALTP